MSRRQSATRRLHDALDAMYPQPIGRFVRESFSWLDDRMIRRRAHDRGVHIMRVRGREAERRDTLGLGLNKLISETDVLLFAATLKECADYIDKLPKKPSRFVDDQAAPGQRDRR